MVAAPQFTFNVLGAGAWNFGFSRMGEKVRDWRPFFQAIVEDFKKSEAKQFASEGSYGFGEQWQALSDNPPGAGYATWKEEHWPGRPILVASGLLRNAVLNPLVEMTETRLTITIDDEGDYQVFSKRAGGMVTKHKPAVAKFHQDGVPGRLPARPIIAMPKSQLTRWGKIGQSFLVDQMRGNSWNV